jgi:hypothetical protein
MNADVVERIVEGFAFLGFFTAAVMITKILADNWTKRRFAAAQVSEEIIRAFHAGDREGAVAWALRWGLVSCGLGLALVMVQLLPYNFSDPIVYGLMLLFAGGGLIANSVILNRARA